MHAEAQTAIMKRLYAAIHEPADNVGARSTWLSIDRYTSPAELDREQLALFRGQPVIVAHVSDLTKPRSFVTECVGGVPLVILRDNDGEIRVFINACRHRGARLLDGVEGSCKRAITCRYHAWSYQLDGSLIHVPQENMFEGFDKSAHNLRSVPHEIRHGFVWVVVDGKDASLDIASALGPVLDEDFDGFELAEHVSVRKVTTVRRANWKLVMDAFAEGYHVQSLHRESLARFFGSGGGGKGMGVSLVDDCSPHVRQVGSRKTLLEKTEENFDLRKDTTTFYNVFPNVVLVFHPHWITHLSMFPVGVDQVRVIHRMLAPRESLDEETRERLDKSFKLIHEQVFEKEDLSIAESIQSTLASGANDHVLVGGAEEGMRLFHEARDRAIGER